MVIGTLELSLRLEGCRSLKDKRRILRSLTERVRKDFHVAVAEVADHDLWGNACVGIACVSDNAAHADSILEHVLQAFDNSPVIAVEGAQKEVIRT